MQLARDAQTSGDPISAENYFQHAEHYFRLIAAAQEQFRQNNPHLARVRRTRCTGARDEGFDDGDDDGASRRAVQARHPTVPASEPYLPRDAQPFPQQQQPQPQRRASTGNAAAEDGDVDRLPSFITGGQQPQQHQPHQGQQPDQNGHDSQGDRFPLHRRRRRHRGPRPDAQGGGDGGDEPTARE